MKGEQNRDFLRSALRYRLPSLPPLPPPDHEHPSRSLVPYRLRGQRQPIIMATPPQTQKSSERTTQKPKQNPSFQTNQTSLIPTKAEEEEEETRSQRRTRGGLWFSNSVRSLNPTPHSQFSPSDGHDSKTTKKKKSAKKHLPNYKIKKGKPGLVSAYDRMCAEDNALLTIGKKNLSLRSSFKKAKGSTGSDTDTDTET